MERERGFSLYHLPPDSCWPIPYLVELGHSACDVLEQQEQEAFVVSVSRSHIKLQC